MEIAILATVVILAIAALIVISCLGISKLNKVEESFIEAEAREL